MVYTSPLVDLFPQTVTHASWTGMSTDGYASPTYSTSASTFQALVIGEQRLVRTFDGIEELAVTTVYLASTSTFSALDRFTLPDTSTPELLSLETFSDEDGVAFTVLAFGA